LKTKDIKELNNGFKAELYYQIFIEPKGNDYIGDDGTFKTGKEGWKEQFLEEITEKYGFDKVIRAENLNYRLIGLPFFNKIHISNFKKEYDQLLNK
jgi:type III restriction enzyme